MEERCGAAERAKMEHAVVSRTEMDRNRKKGQPETHIDVFVVWSIKSVVDVL